MTTDDMRIEGSANAGAVAGIPIVYRAGPVDVDACGVPFQIQFGEVPSA
ncbi:MAG: hypothetical protein QM630_06305 [Microbacterium sp.]